MNSEKAHGETASVTVLNRVRNGLKRRYRAERRFRIYGILSLTLAISALVILLADIVSKGYTAFWSTNIKLEFLYDAQTLGIDATSDPSSWTKANYDALIKKALRNRFPSVTNRRDRRALNALISYGTIYELRDRLTSNPELIDQRESLWVLASDDVDDYLKEFRELSNNPTSSRLSEQQVSWLKDLWENGDLERKLNRNFFTMGDSRNAEMAGVWGATIGSLMTLGITLLLSFPMGAAAAVYLEEFAPRNRLTELIEVNINNLAAVPSIIFGLLGLAIFINLAGMPRSTPIVGGLVLTLMTLPRVIIPSRSAIKAVPPSLRDAALSLGASPLQTVTHHVLPSALPGMLTGAIVGMAQALGETAPLLMIGMVAFIVDIPASISDSATVLPVQIYLWADSPERGFVALSSAAIMVLLVFLVIMNSLAVYLRRRLEKQW